MMCSLPRVILIALCALTSLILCFCAVPIDEDPMSRELLSKLLLTNSDLVPVNPELLPTKADRQLPAKLELSPANSDQFPADPEMLEPPAPNSTVLPNSPQFVVRLPDKNLLCFSIEGFELFAYNLITSNYLVLNGFLNLTSIPEIDGVSQIRGFGDVGMIIKAVDRRIKMGKRFFKHLIYGEKKKAIMQGFGEVDLKRGAISFSLLDGHSNIESQQSPHEMFSLTLDKPQTNIVIISSNGHTFNVYVEDCTGLLGIDMHGLIGEHTTQPSWRGILFPHVGSKTLGGPSFKSLAPPPHYAHVQHRVAQSTVGLIKSSY